jgi:hypothetical protein
MRAVLAARARYNALYAAQHARKAWARKYPPRYAQLATHDVYARSLACLKDTRPGVCGCVRGVGWGVGGGRRGVGGARRGWDG